MVSTDASIAMVRSSVAYGEGFALIEQLGLRSHTISIVLTTESLSVYSIQSWLTTVALSFGNVPIINVSHKLTL
jgi:hypothetical protein